MINQHDKSYKFALQPELCTNELCVDFLSQCFGHTRFVYNYFLNFRSESYKKHGVSVSYEDTSKALTQLKKQDEFTWLKEIPSIPLQQKLRHLDRAFKSFFNPKLNTRYPRFKKKLSRQSCSFLTSGKTYVGDGYVVISQHKKRFVIPFVQHREFDISRVKSFNISKESNGKYFISCVVKEDIEELPKIDTINGIDLGIKDYCVMSDGTKVSPLKALLDNERKLQRLSRSLSRKKIGSNNRAKAREKVELLHTKTKNQRHDYLHQVSKDIINKNQVICLETLSVKNMLKDRKLSKHIADASWSKFVDLITYKAKWYGRDVVKIDRYFPSSKMCHSCETINDNLKLNDRLWECGGCGEMLDRDLNAAINIRDEATRMMALAKISKKKKSRCRNAETENIVEMA